ncbi:MAG: DNA methyltransferase [Myxococcota bacterium]
MSQAEPRRTVHCQDALAWLQEPTALKGASVVTSLPDVSELGLDLSTWKKWFTDTAALILERTPPDAVAIFYQTDVKKEGQWVDKGYLVHAAAERVGARLLWHKIVCRRPAGTVTFGRPAYSHMQCYSRGLTLDLSRSTADVLPDAGEMNWSRAMGVNACLVACRFIRDHTRSHVVVDPFCGKGTVLAVANALGLDAVGVELSRKRAKAARGMRVVLGDDGKPHTGAPTAPAADDDGSS